MKCILHGSVARAALLGALVVGCKSNGAGVACQAAGGQCFLGSFRATCRSIAPSAQQDCNPDQNAAGGFCCLQEPEPDASADAGDAETGPVDAAGRVGD
jgi:hypothetical protein